MNQEFSGQLKIAVVKDLSAFVRDSVEDLRNTLILGAIFTILVVFAFLNSWRGTVITGLTLPVSIISAFIAMRVFGFTLNILTLMGLVTKNAILLIDYINKLRRGGMERDDALGRAGNTRLRPIVMTALAL